MIEVRDDCWPDRPAICVAFVPSGTVTVGSGSLCPFGSGGFRARRAGWREYFGLHVERHGRERMAGPGDVGNVREHRAVVQVHHLCSVTS
jgi:hypothetical protein